MTCQAVSEKLIETIAHVAQGCGRRIDVRVFGALSDDLLRGILMTGAVREMVSGPALVDCAIVDMESASDGDLMLASWLCSNALLLFDPAKTPPVCARRRVLRYWPDLQAWVLPLEGDDAFSGGMISAAPAIRADTPRISATMPVNLEEHDVERVLASMLPIAQEWVVGVDQKSTDGTLAIVERYADRVFRFDISPWSFAEARNQCIDRCTQPWIFMTEGHESFDPGSIAMLRNVGTIGIKQGVVMVGRDTGGEDRNAGEYFHFPWVFRNHPSFRFVDQNGVHNALKMDGYAEAVGSTEPVCVRMPGVVRTFHKAHESNREQRHKQRKDMNRDALDKHADETEDGLRARALFYSAQEHASAGDLRTAIRRAIRYVKEGDTFKEQLYEAHLRLGEYLIALGRPRASIGVMRRGIQYDLTRNELEIVMADAYMILADNEAARQLYAKAAGVPLPNYSAMFVRKACYRALPWQGLATACFNLGESGKARDAARACLHFDPKNEVALKILSSVGEAVA